MITDEENELAGMYLHFCPENNYRAIDETCPEFQTCRCEVHMKKTWFYWRKDNTVRQLVGGVNEMVWQLSEELAEGNTGGTLISKQDQRTLHCTDPHSFLKNASEFLFDIEAEG